MGTGWPWLSEESCRETLGLTLVWSLGPGDLEGPRASLIKDRKVDGDCGPLYISQMLVRAEMDAPMGDMEELDSPNPQGSSLTVTFWKEIYYFYLCHNHALWREL